MKGALLGPSWDDGAIGETLTRLGAVSHELGEDELAGRTAELLSAGDVVGWFQGRMEYGPRALGNRSILGDPRDPGMQSRMNLKIKFRESFRPFAPAVSMERAGDYFDLDRESPYMLRVARVTEGVRDGLPAVTHVDGSARVQTVGTTWNPRFRKLLSGFERLTGCAVLVNTSFNVRGEPIVCTPEDAYRCFMKTGMDHLLLGSWLLHKGEQPEWVGVAAGATGAKTGDRRRGVRGPVAALSGVLYRAWKQLGAVLGWVQLRLLFGAVYVLLVIPYGMVSRSLGKCPLELGFDPGARSYRRAAKEQDGGMDRPY
jgi:hypothetical protein